MRHDCFDHRSAPLAVFGEPHRHLMLLASAGGAPEKFPGREQLFGGIFPDDSMTFQAASRFALPVFQGETPKPTCDPTPPSLIAPPGLASVLTLQTPEGPAAPLW